MSETKDPVRGKKIHENPKDEDDADEEPPKKPKTTYLVAPRPSPVLRVMDYVQTIGAKVSQHRETQMTDINSMFQSILGNEGVQIYQTHYLNNKVTLPSVEFKLTPYQQAQLLIPNMFFRERFNVVTQKIKELMTCKDAYETVTQDLQDKFLRIVEVDLFLSPYGSIGMTEFTFFSTAIEKYCLLTPVKNTKNHTQKVAVNLTSRLFPTLCTWLGVGVPVTESEEESKLEFENEIHNELLALCYYVECMFAKLFEKRIENSESMIISPYDRIMILDNIEKSLDMKDLAWIENGDMQDTLLQQLRRFVFDTIDEMNNITITTALSNEYLLTPEERAKYFVSWATHGWRLVQEKDFDKLKTAAKERWDLLFAKAFSFFNCAMKMINKTTDFNMSKSVHAFSCLFFDYTGDEKIISRFYFLAQRSMQRNVASSFLRAVTEFNDFTKALKKSFWKDEELDPTPEDVEELFWRHDMDKKHWDEIPMKLPFDLWAQMNNPWDLFYLFSDELGKNTSVFLKMLRRITYTEEPNGRLVLKKEIDWDVFKKMYMEKLHNMLKDPCEKPYKIRSEWQGMLSRSGVLLYIVKCTLD